MTTEQIDIKTDLLWKRRLTDIQLTYRETTELLDYIESIHYHKGIADCCKILGYCFWRFSDYLLSMQYSLRALDIYKKLGDKKSESDTLNNIGAVYMFQNDNEKRLEVNIKCKKLREEVGDYENAMNSEGNIGETYMEMKDYKNAVKCFNTVLKSKHSLPQATAWAFHNLGKIAFIQKKYTDALNLFNSSLKISLDINYGVLTTETYIEIAKTHLTINQYDDALEYAFKSLNISKEIGTKEGQINALNYLTLIYEQLGEFKKALDYLKEYNILKEQINKSADIERLKSTQLQVAFEKIEEQKKELIDSIKYAKRIQKAVLKREQKYELLQNYFVFFEPKDIVSGDFYWYFEKEDEYYFCVADCTGHGVPGAFLTMLGSSFLNEIISVNNNLSPAEILTELREKIIFALSQNLNNSNKDGMDISLVKFNKKNNKIEWAGANNPLIIVRAKINGDINPNSPYKLLENETYKLYEIKANKQPISISKNLQPYTNHTFQLQKGDIYYLCTDGYKDQFGGITGKKFLSVNFRKLLLSLSNDNMPTQKRKIKKVFFNWKDDLEQLDDVCVVGVKI